MIITSCSGTCCPSARIRPVSRHDIDFIPRNAENDVERLSCADAAENQVTRMRRCCVVVFDDLSVENRITNFDRFDATFCHALVSMVGHRHAVFVIDFSDILDFHNITS